MHKIYLRQALITFGFSRVLRHSNSNNTFISIVFGVFGTPCIYHYTINNGAHNTIIYPVCLYNVFFTKNCQKLHILYAGELINDLMTLYKAIQGVSKKRQPLNIQRYSLCF